MTKGESGLSVGPLKLERALHQPGCPICCLADEAVSEYLLGLQVSHLNDGKTMAHPTRRHGLCRRHTWQFHQGEIARYGDPRAGNLLYAHVMAAVAAGLARGQPPASSRPPGPLTLLRRALRALRLGGRLSQPPPPIAAGEPCPACMCEADTQRSYLSRLAIGCTGPWLPAAHARPQGLRLPDLRLALGIASVETPETACLLVGDTKQRLTTSRADLERYSNRRSR